MCTEERKPRPHAAIIKAWADGAIIQCRSGDGKWIDVRNNLPTWAEREVYRVKPKPINTVRYRRYAYRFSKAGDVAVAIQQETHPKYIADLERASYFVKWIDDEWQYHEIEVK